MYYCEGNNVVGVLNDWGLATVLSSSATPNTDRTGTIPFMALQLLKGERVAQMFRHDVESFIWLFLWLLRWVKEGGSCGSLQGVEEAGHACLQGGKGRLPFGC